jgi:hypothetical protein
MKKKINIVIIIILIIQYSHIVYSQQFAKVGTSGTQFLKIGVGARSVGMGGACVASIDDASAIFWNPSGIVKVKNYSVILSHVEWLADIRYEAIGFAKTIPEIGTFGLSGSFLTSGEMEVTTFQQQSGTGETFAKTDFSIGISFAKNLTDRFAFGGTIKYVREDYGTKNNITGKDEVTSALAFDVGAHYLLGLKTLRLGIVIQNFGPEMKIPGKYADIIGYDTKTQDYQREPEEDFRPYHMPLIFRVGLAIEVFKNNNNKLTITGDLIHPNDNKEYILFGSEFWFNDIFALRGGFIGGHDSAQFAVGGSLKLSVVQLGNANLDYAYTDYGILNMVHQMSFVFNF